MEFTTVRICIGLLVLIVQQSSAGEWGEWSDWTQCINPCQGDVANQTRACTGDSGCHGDSVRYRLCEKGLCGNGTSTFRVDHCMSYNNISFHGKYYEWVPDDRPRDPCALTCHVVGESLTVAVLPVVPDGTRCGPGFVDVCLKGECKHIGCDNIVGSGTNTDTCGVCGGDGTSCGAENHTTTSVTPDLPQWEVRWTSCSVSCGTGYQKSIRFCKDVKSGQTVDESQCEDESRPKDVILQCEMSPCRYRWHEESWSACTRSCGGGAARRHVDCVDYHDGLRKHVSREHCKDDEPITEMECNKDPCPEWLAGEWSPCSVTCGRGFQYRDVVCRTTGTSCSDNEKPATRKICHAGLHCPGSQEGHENLDTTWIEQLSLQRPPSFEASLWGACSATCGRGYRQRTVVCSGYQKYSLRVEILPDRNCSGAKPLDRVECVLSDCPTVSVSPAAKVVLDPVHLYEWRYGEFGPCSRSCKGGEQKATTVCFHRKKGRPVDSSHCAHITAPEAFTRACNVFPCPPRWQVGDFTVCSTLCGGGVQRRDVSCVQDTARGKTLVVPTFRCPDPVPVIERTCNMQFCPAKWENGVWAQCSRTCGLGVQIRPVFCVKTPVAGRRVNVSEMECLGPKPPVSRPCHEKDCYPDLSRRPLIKTKNSTFIQLERTKQVRLVVGETAVLLPRQSVKIHCPVKNFHKKLLFWTKNHRLIPMAGRVKVTFNGALKIRRAQPEVDSGIFTCIAGSLSASVSISFQSKGEARRKKNEIMQHVYPGSSVENLINKPQADKYPDEGPLSYTEAAVNSPGEDVIEGAVFVTADWSECSRTCGIGLQSRKVTCNYVQKMYIKVLPNYECSKKGLEKPQETRKCSINPECPQWKVGEWTNCDEWRCKRDGFAAQTRPLHCIYKNQTKAAGSMCDTSAQPQYAQECSNNNCVSLWHTNKWSQCKPSCGSDRGKHRIMTCVWQTTKTSAGNNCKSKPRPSVWKTCKPVPCSSACVDTSRYCSLAGLMKLCRYQNFQKRCCHTCKNVTSIP